jgi:hypothetical protein
MGTADRECERMHDQPLAYRFDLQERLPSGEPVFRYIPPYLPVA